MYNGGLQIHSHNVIFLSLFIHPVCLCIHQTTDGQIFCSEMIFRGLGLFFIRKS